MSPRRNRRIRESTIWAAAIAAVIVHVAVLGTVHALGLSWISSRRPIPASQRPAADETDLAATCAGDVALATSGRAAMCLAPWIGNVDDCLADAQMSLWMDLSACDARNDPGTAITMVAPKAVNRLIPIDPERLLEEAKQNAQKPPPPPPPQIAAAQPPPPPPPPPPQRAQQVIETVKPSEEKEPDNARFVSEFNTKAEKEKVSRGARNEPMVAKAKPESLTPKDKPVDEPSVKPHDDRVVGMNEHAPDLQGKLSMRTPGALAPGQAEQEAKIRGAVAGATGEMSADGYLARRGDAAIAQDRHDRSEVPHGETGAGGGAPVAPILKPSQEILERAVGGGSVDHLENVEDADETSLSSKRWIYASFFNRLKRQVAQNWDPGSVWRRADPRGAVYGVKTRFTGVRVSLSRTGELEKVLVTEPSGVSILDDEAVRAFRASGPFPNPPEGLVQKDNLITFQFGFYFGVGEPKMSWRMPTSM
ncbi:MAG TPA: TonB family protein [Kofleriaceae bacterium]|jgi:TonB family protein|nr:TonB family protein [Kofleriaceae bacterium]